ncbi:6,7-dimethyl-8-ribityllumazine synthase [Desulfovibrio sp. JY]|nr:6,7-dimethyl-8-ribityllumazine synthase [Desulfovibrio sp. JY]
MQHVTTIEGQLDAKGLKFAIVAGRFNDFITERLVGGAIDYLTRNGADRADLTIVRVPGAFEIPLAAKKLAASAKYNGVICLGAVIRGATPHFEYVANECVKGLAHVMLETNVPVGFGVLTVDTLEQAIERAGSKAGNKGVEASAAVLEMVRVMEQL